MVTEFNVDRHTRYRHVDKFDFLRRGTASGGSGGFAENENSAPDRHKYPRWRTFEIQP
jgi:hypothetical protein